MESYAETEASILSSKLFPLLNRPMFGYTAPGILGDGYVIEITVLQVRSLACMPGPSAQGIIRLE